MVFFNTAAPAPVIRQDERAKRVGLQVRARDIRASCTAQRAQRKASGNEQKNLCVLCAVQGRTNFHVAPGRALDVDAVQGSTNVARDRMSGATVLAAKTP